MSKCLNFRHDNPALAGTAVPDTDESMTDTEELEIWCKELTTRKDNTIKARIQINK
jgi:hypothetical protein